MNSENSFSPTLERLTRLITRKYNCGFKYQSLTELSQDNFPSLKHSLSGGEPVTAGDWVFFPVFAGNTLAGAGCISNRDTLTNSDIRYLNQIIKLVLEASLSRTDRLETLAGAENHIEAHADNKIIPLRSFRKNLFPLPENDVSSAFNFPFLIESKSSDDIYMMAIEIHSRTNRYAMIPFEDLSPSVFEHPDGLKSLGHISIFVKDVSALTIEQQEQIVRYYHSPRDKECPQFIAGTRLPIGILKESRKLTKSLIPLLTIGYLCMSKSFAVYKRENVLDFFYDSLTGRTSV